MATTYKIGEAAALLNLKTYVLRFWETEFPEIVPLRTEKGQRLYTEEHLALLERIRYLLHDRGLTIGGARKTLAEEKARGVVYTYGAPSAVARDDMRDGLILDPVLPVGAQDSGDEGEDPASEEEQDLEPLGPDTEPEGVRDNRPGMLPQAGRMLDAVSPQDQFPFSPLLPPARQGSAKQRSQCNLPGLDQIVALRKAIAAEKMESAGGAEQPLPGNASPERVAQGMLPLFAMVRSAFLAGKAAGAALPDKGGDNFIQAGSDAVEAAFPSTPLSGPLPGQIPPAGVPREALRRLFQERALELALELEEVAGILRADAPTPPPSGGHSPESS